MLHEVQRGFKRLPATTTPCRKPAAAQALAAAGAGPTLTVLAAGSSSSEASRLAGETLQNLQQQVGWRQLQLHRQQAPQSLARAASDSNTPPAGGVPAYPGARSAWPQHLGRAASAPAPLPPVPEQAAVGMGLHGSAHNSAQGRARRGSLDSATAAPSGGGGDADAWSKVQRWQQQQAQQGGGTAVAHLVASLGSPIPRNQLAAAEQLAALAASGGRAASAIAAAGGTHALLACVRDSTAGSSLGGSSEALESPLGPSIGTAALRALCTYVLEGTLPSILHELTRLRELHLEGCESELDPGSTINAALPHLTQLTCLVSGWQEWTCWVGWRH